MQDPDVAGDRAHQRVGLLLCIHDGRDHDPPDEGCQLLVREEAVAEALNGLEVPGHEPFGIDALLLSRRVVLQEAEVQAMALEVRRARELECNCNRQV